MGVLDDAERERAHRRRPEVAQPPECLADAEAGFVARPFQRVPVHAHRGGARAFQGAPDGRAVAQLGQGVPPQPARDEGRQVGASREPAFALQGYEVAQPLPVRR